MRAMSAFRRTALGPVAGVLLPVYLSACFHYVPESAEWRPAPGINIRATFERPEPFNMGTVTVNDVTRLEGTVVDTAADSLGVWVKWLYPMVGEKYDANSAQFYVRRSNISQWERWRVSGRNTALLVAVSAGFVVGMLSLVAWAVGKSSELDGNGPPIQVQVR